MEDNYVIGSINDLNRLVSNMYEANLIRIVGYDEEDSKTKKLLLLNCNMPLEFDIDNEDFDRLLNNKDVHILSVDDCGLEIKMLIELKRYLSNFDMVHQWYFYRHKEVIDNKLRDLIYSVESNKKYMTHYIRDVDLLSERRCRMFEIVGIDKNVIICYVPVNNCKEAFEGSILVSCMTDSILIKNKLFSVEDMDKIKRFLINLF